MLSHFTLKTKLAAAPFVFLCALLAVSAMSFLGFSRLSLALESIDSQRLPSYTFSSELESNLRDLNGLVNQSIAFEAVGYSESEISAVDKEIAALSDRMRKKIESRITEVGEDQRVRLGGVAKSFSAYRQEISSTLEMKATGIALASTYLSTANASYKEIIRGLSQISSDELRQAGLEVAAAREASRRIRLVMVSTAVAMSLLAVGCGAHLVRSILIRIRHISKAVNQLARGDLRSELAQEGSDELGTLMRDTETVRCNLALSMQSVQRVSDSVRVAANEIAAGNVDLGNRTEHTSAALQRTTCSTQQLTMALDATAGSAEQVAKTATQAAAAAHDGGQLVADAVHTMNEISEASRKISDITGVINTIAFQTNILSLNAAVEAARAGEQGRGFSVVASEVRSLAQRCAEAAKEISVLISSSNERVEGGRRAVLRAGDSISRLVGQVSDVASLVGDMHRTTKDQSIQLGELSRELSGVEVSTQQNAALVEESSAASESLRGQADQLASALERFQVA